MGSNAADWKVQAFGLQTVAVGPATVLPVIDLAVVPRMERQDEDDDVTCNAHKPLLHLAFAHTTRFSRMACVNFSSGWLPGEPWLGWQHLWHARVRKTSKCPSGGRPEKVVGLQVGGKVIGDSFVAFWSKQDIGMRLVHGPIPPDQKNLTGSPLEMAGRQDGASDAVTGLA